MSDKTKIKWTDATWNPITGCSVVSAGCKNCYAMKLAGTRLQHHPSRAGLTVDTKNGPVWTGEVRFNEQLLDQPLRWKRPRMVFVCAHADLFHYAVPDEWIDKVFAVMALAKHHVFQVLTKRPERMREYMIRLGRSAKILDEAAGAVGYTFRFNGKYMVSWPISNVWLGVSVENQATADERIPLLRQIPAAVRWISAEPLLGPVDLFSKKIISREANNADCRYAGDYWVDWVVVGGESGTNSRPMHPAWARSLRDQCAVAGVPFLFKQHGEWIDDENIDSANLRAPEISDPNECFNEWDWGDGLSSWRVGKKAAGRLLDGVQHDGYPEGGAA